MNDNSIKWIPCNGIDLNPVNVSALEKLKKFGYVFMFNEFGAEKLSKVELCIYDVVSEKEKPNILLICPSYEIYSWYRILMTGIGVDFKIVSGSSNSISYFSEEFSNLYIISRDSIKKGDGIQSQIPPSFIWDMVIIDEEQCCTPDSLDMYITNIKNAADSLIFISSKPANKAADYEKYRELVLKIMNDPNKSLTVKEVKFDINAAEFNNNVPVTRFFNEKVYSGEMNRKIVEEHYSFDEETLASLRRRVDLRTGMPHYIYGGNMFEEFDCELKSVYAKPYYTATDVKDLRDFDKKLDAFLVKLDSILENSANRIIVYCVENATLEYLKKVIRAHCGTSDDILKMSKGEIFETKDVVRKLKVDDSTAYPRIILAVDVLSAVGDGLDRITHVINYELPVNASIFEQRMTRHGASRENEREFIFFLDDNGIFDSRILKKVLCGNICGGLLPLMPSRNILFDLPELPDMLADVVLDLKYVNSYSAEVDSCFDLIKKFNGDYNVRDAKIENAKQLSEYSAKKLDAIVNAFGFEKIETENHEELSAMLSEKLAQIGKGLLYLDENGKITAINGDELKKMLYNDAYEAEKNGEYITAATQGIESSKNFIKDMHDKEFFMANVKETVNELSESIRFPVLYGIWRYRVRERGSQKSFSEFIKIYNDGVV